MLTAVSAGAGHPLIAALLGLGAAGLAGAIVAMAWSVHVRQFRLAELLARRAARAPAEPAPAPGVNGNGVPGALLAEPGPPEVTAAASAPADKPSPVVIEGPDAVVAGDQARYRARLSGGGTVVSWAVGGGAVSQAPDPDHPDELLLIADQPGSLTVIVRVRKGLAERRATKAVIAEPEAPSPAPPFTLRLFLHGWSLVVVAVLVIGLAGALVALGSFSAADFISLAVPLMALLGMAAVVRGSGEESGRSRRSRPPTRPQAESPWYGPPGQPGQSYAPPHPGEPAHHN